MTENVNINWFPGHMTKARRQMEEILKSADMVLELRDARIPEASRNPLLDKMIQNKPRVLILTKLDKADPQETAKWLKHLEQENSVLALDLVNGNLVQPITDACMQAMKEKHERQRKRGINPRAIRAMVVGIPNVGKSTMINRLARRKAARVADTPGVTRSITTIVINDKLHLLDTPGVLWPKFEDPKTALYLAVSGAINDNVLPLEEVCYFALNILKTSYAARLKERYEIDCKDKDAYALLEEIGMLRKDLTEGKWDKNKTIAAFLKDIRNEKLGRITWERYEPEQL